MHSKSSPVLAFHFAFEETCYFGQQIFYLLIAACSTKSSGMKCDQHERFESKIMRIITRGVLANSILIPCVKQF
jgi:hypothetical protein